MLAWPASGVAALQAQERNDRAAAWASAGTVLVGALLLDGFLREELAAGGPDEFHGLSRVGNHVGRGKFMATALAGGYLVGRAVSSESISRSTQNTFVALAAAGAVNGALKVAVGRQRPTEENRTDRFRPFSLDDGWQSFPSGHVVTAFALATSISEQTTRPWLKVASYGTAGLVAWSRVHEDRHWTSDVVAGALVGSITARATLRALERRERSRAAGGPSAASWTAGAALSVTPSGIQVSIPLR